jgi:hypothetical protein
MMTPNQNPVKSQIQGGEDEVEDKFELTRGSELKKVDEVYGEVDEDGTVLHCSPRKKQRSGN